MSFARTLHLLVVDLDQLNCLYHQLNRVPEDVQELFRSLDKLYGRLLDISGNLLSSKDNQLPDAPVQEILRFRRQLVDLELFIDPNQMLPRSCSGQHMNYQIEWSGQDGAAVKEYCNRFSEHLTIFEELCKSILLTIDLFHEKTKGVAWADVSGMESPGIVSLDLDLLSLPSTFSSNTSFSPDYTPLASPWLSPYESPNIEASAATPHSILGLTPAPVYSGPPQPPPLSLGEALHQPRITNFSRPRRPKKKEKTMAERRVHQLLEDEFGKPQTAGVKRKRNDTESRKGTYKSLVHAPFPQDGSPVVPGRHSPPPIYPPSSIRLGPSDIPYEHPTWSLDDLTDALPPLSPTTTCKGKQRALETSPVRDWDRSSSVYTRSSSNDQSGHSSIREGSVLSDPIPGHAFAPGSCKIWYSHGSKLNQLAIVNIDIRTQPSNNAITLVLKTDSGQEILDNLWISQANTNAAPFLEHGEILAAMRDQHDASIHSVVHFAPNPSKHPQYSFTTHGDCQDFMRAVVGKLLIASVDVATIKSACTHGNKYEVGCETMQIWQDPNSAPGNKSRSVRIFRNKNPAATAAVVEIPMNCLRVPERDNKSGKLFFGLRDVQDPAVREMKYLKIAFSNDLARDEFPFQTGFIDTDC